MNFHNEAILFLDRLFFKIKESKFEIKSYWDIDHLCYRVKSDENYLNFKEQFLKFSDLLIESPVNGRLISTFKLHQPVEYENWHIQLVELPAPKPGKATIEGFEHIEIVIDQPFVEIENQYSHLPHDKSGLRKSLNQEFEFCFGDINLKLHQMSLESVITLEKNTIVSHALEKSKVLEILKENQPLVAGTFPLGIDVAGSDLDILLYSTDLTSLSEKIQLNWGSIKNFRINQTSIDKTDTLIASFILENIPFELFAQDIPSVQQKAYRHFLAEEKILKLKDKDFKKEIVKLKKEGMKTEPAFARLLNLSGDPYQAITQFLKMNSH